MPSHLFDIVLRSGVIYFVVIVGLRLLGKKHVAQLSIIDLVLILLISNAVQNAMVGDDSSLLGGVVAAGALLLINYLLTVVLYKFRLVDRLFEGTPTLLVYNGNVIFPHLAQEKITFEELERVVREHGIGTVQEVKIAVMEVDGTVSVVSRSGSEHKIENFRHRRPKFQPRKQ
jgi:uncharacterized membrane protein YcaP (DUF421 family)